MIVVGPVGLGVGIAAVHREVIGAVHGIEPPGLVLVIAARTLIADAEAGRGQQVDFDPVEQHRIVAPQGQGRRLRREGRRDGKAEDFRHSPALIGEGAVAVIEVVVGDGVGRQRTPERPDTKSGAAMPP